MYYVEIYILRLPDLYDYSIQNLKYILLQADRSLSVTGKAISPKKLSKGSLIGSLIGSIIGFFTLGPLGSIGFGALGGLIGVLISRFVGDKCLKSSKLALRLEKKLKTKQQEQEEQEQRHTVQTTLPALTASRGS